MESIIEEKENIKHAQQGSQEAFAWLVRRYGRKVYRVAYTFLHNQEDAADVIQDLYIKVWRNITRFDFERPLFPWLYQITRNLCLNRMRKKTERELPSEEKRMSENQHDPITTVEAAQRTAEIRNAVNTLPDKSKEIILLKYFDGCTYQEMAEILDIPVGTVMSRLYNARKVLKEILEVEA